MICVRRPGSIASRPEAAGFTLLEVMVAMAVLGIALLALLTLHHQSLQSVIHSRDIARAGMLCQTIMTQAELEQFPRLGVTRGNFVGNGTSWNRESSPTCAR